MFPAHLLPDLTPTAAKLYLTLLSQLDKGAANPLVSATIEQLSHISAVSPRTCKEALRHLRRLGLIASIPRRYHAPNTYILLPLPKTDGQPAALLKTNGQSTAPLQPTKMQPPAPFSPSNGQHPAPLPQIIPVPVTKNPVVQSAAPLLNTNVPPITCPTQIAPITGDPEIDHQLAILKLLMPNLPEDKKNELIATTQDILAQLDAKEAPK